MRLEQATVLSHTAAGSLYRVLDLRAPLTAAEARPGQFVHVQIPNLQGSLLRRPFSLYAAGDATLRILYKVVGTGTRALTVLRPGQEVSLLGPLGNGFPMDRPSGVPALVAGGYGVAPLCFLARRLPTKGVVFIGGASADHILCADEFRALGWDVRVTTEDGSAGVRGLVTAAMDAWTAERGGGAGVELYACGPDGMLKAVATRAASLGVQAWLSMDRHMGCGAGVCLACVQRIRRDGREQWIRVCKDGPVLDAREIVWK
jgi:dihydroorotate dehydrogenase electron transfer subunit